MNRDIQTLIFETLNRGVRELLSVDPDTVVARTSDEGPPSWSFIEALDAEDESRGLVITTPPQTRRALLNEADGAILRPDLAAALESADQRALIVEAVREMLLADDKEASTKLAAQIRA